MAEEVLHHYELHVKMSCSGCSGAVERVLGKLDGNLLLPLLPPHTLANPPAHAGVKDYKTDLTTQKVTVTADETVDLDKIQTVIGKTGKEIVSAKKVDP